MRQIDIQYLKFISHDNSTPVTRLILVADGLAFYRSSGVNAGAELAGTFLPFLGVEPNCNNSGWLRKPWSMDELSHLLLPLMAILKEHYQEESSLSSVVWKRFASLKGMLVSSLLDEALQREEEPPASFLASTSYAHSEEKSFWRTRQGVQLKAFLKERYPDFYQNNQYNLHFNRRIIDIRGTVKYSCKQRSLFTQINGFLEMQLQKPLALDFSAAAFEENLTQLDMIITPAQDNFFYQPVPHGKVKTPLLKKAKDTMAELIEATGIDKLPPVIAAPFQPRQPVKYTQLIWPESLEELGINEEQRAETERFIFIAYESIFADLFSAHQTLLETNNATFFYSSPQRKISAPGAGDTFQNHLYIKCLHNGQIIVYPSEKEMLYEKREKNLTVFKVFNVTTGQWMVLKSSAPKRLMAEVLSLSDKEGISPICDFTLDEMIVTTYNANGQILNKKYHNQISIIEPFYPRHFIDILLEKDSVISLEQKAGYMLQLLKGLASIHALPCPATDIPDSVRMSAFHGDIKISNVMFMNGKPFFMDFDSFGDWDMLTHSSGWLTPEGCKFLHVMLSECMTKEDALQFHQDHGQAMDIWNLAMIFVMILTKPVTNGYYRADIHFPPFYFLHNRLNNPEQSDRYHFDLMTLTQKEIDAEIECFLQKLPDTLEGRKLFDLWSVVIAMLKVDPDKRQSAATLVHVLEVMMKPEVKEQILSTHAALPSCSSVIP